MNPPRGKPRGITERGFAPIIAGGIHPRGKPRGIEPSRLNDDLILEWYRVRWQIELAFKRLKSLAGLGHLPKYDAASSRAWLYGKLLVSLMTERMQRYARAFSPWGTRWFDQDSPAESLA